ncbi:MAG TPA: 3-phosphoserine/phosphohydroxythreonine transaminase [Polyangiaceae bacterium]|jgi:phosphoserine aminotransferase|nr:3-phosphoserine/phosphohydroxythreonine transaminase [Polyangiaceae bacterium]
MNFNAGPAALPLEALERAQRELIDFAGTGMSIIEHSHRGKAYEAVHNEAITLLRELLDIKDTHHVLFLQGGASQQFAMIPMNLLKPGQSADYIVTGAWGKKAIQEAKTVGTVRSVAPGDPEAKPARVPKQSELDLDANAAYVHLTSNETIGGNQFHEFPSTGKAPLVADMSSDILSRPIDVSKFGLIYAGAQKNIGPSGVTLVIVRKDLVEGGRTDIPKIFRYATHAAENSLYNTPATFAVYLVRNVLDVLKKAGGLAAIEKRNHAKAKALYDAIDARPDFYKCPVEKGARSLMNVVFNLPTPELEAEFVTATQKLGMVGLKGHRSVGGIRASIYNAVQPEWVGALAQFMNDFHKGS